MTPRARRPAPGIIGASAVPAGLGLPSATGLLAAMEAGVPIPVPSDLVVLLLGERVSAGRLSALGAFVALELVALVGTTALFLAVRGPGKALLARVGPRLGLTEARLARATAVVDRRGRLALTVGRATPGLRTVTVAAAATSRLTLGQAVPPLVVGSSVFLQLHLFLGWALGPVAREALESAKGPALARPHPGRRDRRDRVVPKAWGGRRRPGCVGGLLPGMPRPRCAGPEGVRPRGPHAACLIEGLPDRWDRQGNNVRAVVGDDPGPRRPGPG